MKPVARDGDGKPSFLQPVPLVEYQSDRTAFSLTLHRAGSNHVWNAPTAFGSFRNAVDLTAPVVFAGYGITAHELGYDDYQGIDARGKIVLVFDHEPQEDNPRSIFNGTGNTRYATTRVKLLNAQKHGAVALLVVAEPNRKHPTNAERAARIASERTRITPLPLQAIAGDEVRIPSVLVQDEVADELLDAVAMAGGDGHQKSKALQTAVDATLKPQSRTLADTSLSLHMRNTEERTSSTWNVAGLLEGSDPRLKAETILITAHHDHDGSAPCLEADGTHPEATGVDEKGTPQKLGPGCLQVWHGADDNGSGTVGVVELARAFAANPTRPHRSILFVVFAAEERGLLGAYYMTQHPLRPLATTRAQINFDMIGRDEKPSRQTDGLIEIPAETANRLNLVGSFYSPDYSAVVREENARVGLVLDDRFDHENALNVFFRSDQFPFVLHDIPAFWWFTGFHPDYHHSSDTVEKINFPKMVRILDLAYLTGWRFGSEKSTPRFVPNPMPIGAQTP